MTNPTAAGTGHNADRSLWLALSTLGFVLTLLLVACSDPREQMQQDLDTFPLPDHLVLVESRSEGPEYCFAADCPNVIRYHVSPRSVEETCDDLQEAVEAWGVTDARWRIGTEANRCSMTAARKGNEFTVSAYDAERLRPDVASKLEPTELETHQAAVNLGLRKPATFHDSLRAYLDFFFPPQVLIPLILGLLLVVALTVRWFRRRRRRKAGAG